MVCDCIGKVMYHLMATLLLSKSISFLILNNNKKSFISSIFLSIFVFTLDHDNPRIESPILCQNVLIWQMQQNISYSATEPRLKLAVNVASILCCCIEVDFNGYCFALWLYFETWQLTKQWGWSLFKVKKIHCSVFPFLFSIHWDKVITTNCLSIDGEYR